jgi:hypothetical protein
MPQPRRIAFACAALVAGLPAVAQEPPPALVETTEAAAAICHDLGGTPEIVDGYETVRDLNGDGRADFVTDLSHLECRGAWGAYCGPSGCPVTVWLSDPEGGAGGDYVQFDLGRLTGFEIRDEAEGLPALVARYAAAACGEDRADDCSRTWRFASNSPEEPPIDPEPTPEPATVTTASPPPPAIPPGWTLRRVPGASPVALGAGIGEIASLAAFCLDGQPFLALNFHERPNAEKVTLGFAFGEGAVEASAGFEQTAGGAYVVALGGGPLAARLAGRDSEVEVTVDGRVEGVLSLKGSTRALRGALEECLEL